MANELPYLPSYKNVGLLFEKIKTAKIPETFTQKFLADILGLKSTGDRPLISLLKSLGFIDNAGKPTEKYSSLKNDNVAGTELAKCIKSAYEPLFTANEKVNELSQSELRGLVAQVAGSDSQTTTKIVGTFKALVEKANFSEDKLSHKNLPKDQPSKIELPKDSQTPPLNFQNMRPDFHYNLQIHLPSNGSEETYMNIFNAIRKVFK